MCRVSSAGENLSTLTRNIVCARKYNKTHSISLISQMALTVKHYSGCVSRSMIDDRTFTFCQKEYKASTLTHCSGFEEWKHWMRCWLQFNEAEWVWVTVYRSGINSVVPQGLTIESVRQKESSKIFWRHIWRMLSFIHDWSIEVGVNGILGELTKDLFAILGFYNRRNVHLSSLLRTAVCFYEVQFTTGKL